MAKFKKQKESDKISLEDIIAADSKHVEYNIISDRLEKQLKNQSADNLHYQKIA